jgi:3-hydroxyisobutyryl-CoA hydrolase
MIDRTLEELSAEREPDEPVAPFTGAKREALDSAFRHNTVEEIFEELKNLSDHSNSEVSLWAKKTLTTLRTRSPTSLKVALRAIRRGKTMTLLECLRMELGLATAFCTGASPDFRTGVTRLLIEKKKEQPVWSPSALEEIPDSKILSDFFSDQSPFLSSTPQFTVPDFLLPAKESDPMRYALPTEGQIGDLVRGSHVTSGSTGITLEELISKLETLRNGKMGIKEKVTEVVGRKCKIVDNNDGNYQWLSWKH